MTLLPFPFCANTNTEVRAAHHWTGMRSVVVSVSIMHWCERKEGELQSIVNIKAKTEAEAVAKWNKRAACGPIDAGYVRPAVRG